MNPLVAQLVSMISEGFEVSFSNRWQYGMEIVVSKRVDGGRLVADSFVVDMSDLVGFPSDPIIERHLRRKHSAILHQEQMLRHGNAFIHAGDGI